MCSKHSNVMFKIWDTDANRTHENIRRFYYAASNAILLIFDLTRRNTFKELQFWVSSMVKVDIGKCSQCIFLIGNKSDQQENRV